MSYKFILMRREIMKKTISIMSGLALLASLFVLPTQVGAKEETGQDVAFGRKAGNCLACHMIPGGNLPGNIGPPLIAMKARYPSKADLRAVIYDPTKKFPHTIMPPFGKHGILTSAQIDKLVDFIHSK
jgi:sulfur-oxidizing protein SoxX